MRAIPIILLMLPVLAGCHALAAETYTSPKGVAYTIERVAGAKVDALPQNSDLKMADGDLVKYAETLCNLDVPANTAPARCDVYIQPDKSGTLIGYAAVMQGNDGVSFETTTTLNEQKEPGGKSCFLDGKIYGNDTNYEKVVSDSSRDFDGRVMYSAWQKDPGNFLVSEVGPDDQTDLGSDTALGVWYVSKKGDKLRISQERWNYCYSSDTVNMDDVFYRAVSLVRVKS